MSLLYHCLKYAVAQFVSGALPSGLQPMTAEKAMPVQINSHEHTQLCVPTGCYYPLLPTSYEV